MAAPFGRPRPSRARDIGLTVVALGALVVAWGSLVPVGVALGLAWLWWGRPLGVAAVLLLALTLAAFAARDGSAKKVRWVSAAPSMTAPGMTTSRMAAPRMAAPRMATPRMATPRMTA